MEEIFSNSLGMHFWWNGFPTTKVANIKGEKKRHEKNDN